MGRKKFNYDVRQDCTECRVTDSGREIGVLPMYSGHALIADFHNEGFRQHWLYQTEEEALSAFDSWDGAGSPQSGYRIHAVDGAAVQ